LALHIVANHDGDVPSALEASITMPAKTGSNKL